MGARVSGSYTAFHGVSRVATGALAPVAEKVKALVDGGVDGPVLVFNDSTGETVELDLRGEVEDVLGRLEARGGGGEPGVTTAETARDEPPRGPGRPKLGVVAREVTLLPRHWDWLNRQPGGASVALRRLVEEARRANAGRDLIRASQEAAYRFLAAVAGNLPGFEEATRALFAGDADRFDQFVGPWPPDVREYAGALAAGALATPSGS